MRQIVPLFAALLFFPLSAHAKAGTPKWEPENGDVIQFSVLRKGKPFGTHKVSFTKIGDDQLIAHTEVDLRAGIGPITVYRYQLDATETWRNGELVSLEGRVNDDGDRGSVEAQRQGEQINVKGTGFDGLVPSGILPSSHWNVEQTGVEQILSTGDGELLNVDVKEQGRENVSIGDTRLPATRYLMDSDIDVSLWYDDAGRWVKLAFSARGQDIEYVLAAPY